MSASLQAELLNKLLLSRGLKTAKARKEYLNPRYEKLHSPNKLPDIKQAVDRIKAAKKLQEKICIYGDYDVDGLTATTLLLDAFSSFGLETMSYIPDRFTEGYGLSTQGVEQIAKQGVSLIITVDCGSKSHEEIKKASKLGIDVIVTDHHTLGETIPACVAVVNPKRRESEYPFKELAGVGVAFKLVQALQGELSGLDIGQEKWLLDLVALGTTCDVVSMTGENRILTKWGIEVARKSQRPAFGALSSVSGIDKSKIDTESFGFRFGPRLNAAGRLLTAKKGLDLLTATSPLESMSLAAQLDTLNTGRRAEQSRIFIEVIDRAKKSSDDVLVLSAEDWSQGVVGIVASKTVERFKKPAFILQELGDETKGSARSFGDFHLADALDHTSRFLVKGGGHALAAGVTMKTSKLDDFRTAINSYYKNLKLNNQQEFLEARADCRLKDLSLIDEELVKILAKLEPFGPDNMKPVFESELTVVEARAVGADGTHLKAVLADKLGNQLDAIGFGLARNFDFSLQEVNVKYSVGLNTFNNRTSVQLELREIN